MTLEAEVIAQLRIAASEAGWRLWRNNNGVALDPTGRPVRYGLGNESPQASKAFKSGDLIGIMPRLISPQDVGQTLGQFVSIEAKRPGWRFTGQGREAAQRKWIDLILGLGGIAGFATKREDIWQP